jgi:hypothetical protein
MIRSTAIAIACAAAACSVPDLDLTGKQCPCVAGWICDTDTNTCVEDPTAPDAPPGGPDAPLADAGGCPSSYLPITGAPARYRVVENLVLWLTAEQDCEDDGGGSHLVIFDDMAERDAVVAGRNGDYWIGITDRVDEGMWRAVTGQTTFFTGGAAPGNNTTDCGLVDITGGTITSQSCFADDSYICECDGVQADPANY